MNTSSRCAFNVWVDRADDGDGFTAYSGFAPGCVTHGRTIREALWEFAKAYALQERAE